MNTVWFNYTVLDEGVTSARNMPNGTLRDYGIMVMAHPEEWDVTQWTNDCWVFANSAHGGYRAFTARGFHADMLASAWEHVSGKAIRRDA